MSLLSLACLDPRFCVNPNHLPPTERLAYWLANPLLAYHQPRKMDATRRTAAGYTTDGEREALITRLQAARAAALGAVGRFAAEPEVSWGALTGLFKDDAFPELHDEKRQRTPLLAYAKTLHPLEYAWLAAHLRRVIEHRAAALEEQREADRIQLDLDYDTAA
ncbi:hypothetical protein F0P96_10395 [Hymenobacter busanensis]|uniref:Uncharacterized protein n=1 Tax=Hymenobacter busanensis TaxID=2607656 RepID=A0A7L5A0L4_9BACT|nr:hypothetical protein [Hymenobacter busanensis]KAA9333369.1 hypothetical protein F0P96_10395 [Hymenobacter busanensis]QHJ07952.1 hypothetical protein GUY19_11915 [Hymenobacter busanensis]